MSSNKEITESITLSDLAKLFPSYNVVRVWTNKCGRELPNGEFHGHTGWYYLAEKQAGLEIKPVQAATMLELIGKITCGAESYHPEKNQTKKGE